MSAYTTVHTGPKSGPGGCHDGLSSRRYQRAAPASSRGAEAGGRRHRAQDQRRVAGGDVARALFVWRHAGRIAPPSGRAPHPMEVRANASASSMK